MAMECGLWYVEDRKIEQGFQIRNTRSPNALLANPTWNGEFHQVEWRWAYSWRPVAGDGFGEGVLRLLFRKPARGRQVDMSAVKGTITIGDDQGHFKGMECSEDYGECSWKIDVDWHDEYGILDAPVSLYTGVVKDDEGNPLIGCDISGAGGGPRGDELLLVGKRDCDYLSGREERILGVGLTGYEYQDYATRKYGKKHRYVDPYYEYSQEDDSEENDSEENDSEETETDSGSNVD